MLKIETILWSINDTCGVIFIGVRRDDKTR